MKKSWLIVAALCGCTSAYAGGYFTNSNQNASFLRMMAQEGLIDITSLYANPAGVAFLSPGFHLSLNLQNTAQNRDIKSTFSAFKDGRFNNEQSTKKFHGYAAAPVVPSFQAAYNTGRWSLQAGFAFVGGGGKLTFEEGLGSFECQAALLSLLGNGLITGYSIDSYMKGSSYIYGLQLGAAYKVNDRVSVSLGGRVVHVSNNYQGYVKNIQVETALQPGVYAAPGDWSLQYGAAAERCMAQAVAAQNAGDVATAQQLQEQARNLRDAAYKMGVMNIATQDVSLNCDQKTWGFTPIIGVDWRINDQWNVAAKYEFRTNIEFKNKAWSTPSCDKLPSLDKFKDGAKVREDIPAILAAGVQYKPMEALRLGLSGKIYFDRQAKQFADNQKNLTHNSWEVDLSAEYDITSRLTASASWQNTNYYPNDTFMKDMNFSLSSNAVGLGVRYAFSDRVSVDLGYMLNFYKSRDKVTNDYNGVSATATQVLGGLATGMMTPGTPEYTAALQQVAASVEQMKQAGLFAGTDHFTRTNYVLGVGVNLKF